MKTKNILQILVILFCIVVFLSSCKDDAGTSQVNFKLTDAPGDYQAVFVEVIGVEVKSNSGTFQIATQAGIYNLLDYTAGLDTLFASGTITEGKISQIRLILGDENSVLIDSVSYPLSTPSAQQSGLKLQVHQDIVAGINYTFTLDFDASKSIVHTGSDKYILKPVIRVLTEANDGGISGVVHPDSVQTAVMAISSSNDTMGTYTNASGEYKILGLAGGTYSLYFSPSMQYNEVTQTGVSVVNGSITNVDTVFLQQ